MLRRLRERLLRATVWAPGVIHDGERDDQMYRRLLLPVFDVVMVGVGFIIARHTVPSLVSEWSDWFVSFLSVAFVVSGSLAFVGVIIPRFVILELVAKTLLMMCMVVYPATLLSRAGINDAASLLAAVSLFALIIIPMGRIIALFPKIRRRHRARVETREIPLPGGGSAE